VEALRDALAGFELTAMNIPQTLGCWTMGDFRFPHDMLPAFAKLQKTRAQTVPEFTR
jgi:hypothetical protein